MGNPFRNQYEPIFVFKKGNGVFIKHNIPSVLSFSRLNLDETEHPHKKPKEMIIKLIEHSSNKESVCLDAFSGSGQFISCFKTTNRRYIGFEIDEKYFKETFEQTKQNSLEDWNNGK